MNGDAEKVEALFQQALKFKPEERSAFLAGACGADDALRERLVEHNPQEHAGITGRRVHEPRGTVRRRIRRGLFNVGRGHGDEVYRGPRPKRIVSLISYEMSLKERAILTQDEPEGGEVAQAGDCSSAFKVGRS